MSGYLLDPTCMTDAQLDAWIENFRVQPPSLDFMREWTWAASCEREHARRQAAVVQWATEDEARERFERETLPTTMGQPYWHRGGCSNCGDQPCYMLCFNHPFNYSADDEIRDFEDAVREGRDHF